MKQNPRRRHIKNQGDLNLAVQTKSIGNRVYSIFNEQKQENLFLDNLVKTVPIPCIFFAAFRLFLWYLGLQKKTLCWGVSSWLSDSCKVPGIFHGSTTRYFLTCLSRTPQSSVRRAPTRRLICLMCCMDFSKSLNDLRFIFVSLSAIHISVSRADVVF